MKIQKTLLVVSAIGVLALLGATASEGKLGWQQRSDAALPSLPVEAQGVIDVLFAQPYVLDQAYVHTWRAERPLTDAGYLLVLEVEEAFTIPRNTKESVLYVGREVAERLNWGTGSGRVIALVPASLDADGVPALDLESALIFYGSPELPERVDAALVQAELAAARAAGVEALSGARALTALEAGGGLKRFADRTTLERHAARLLLEYSPSEAELAESLLVPLLR
ncbi:MAG: hypothetical protein OSB14_07585 [Planctomycetota bacterium]|nr:hypothetical protein [Planctomycetota bacterium]